MHDASTGHRILFLVVLAIFKAVLATLAWDIHGPREVIPFAIGVTVLGIVAFPFGRHGSAAVALMILLGAKAAYHLGPAALDASLNGNWSAAPGIDGFVQASFCVLTASLVAHLCLLVDTACRGRDQATP